jgi:hypothetical protein
MNWHEQYLGKPWTHAPDPPNSFNCGELLRHIYKQYLGYDAPLIMADTTVIASCISDIRDIKRYYAGFRPADIPRDFDVAVMSRSTLERADHVGLYCGGNILHCRPKVGVFLDDVFTLQSFGWRKIAWLRPEGLVSCLR